MGLERSSFLSHPPPALIPVCLHARTAPSSTAATSRFGAPIRQASISSSRSSSTVTMPAILSAPPDNLRPQQDQLHRLPSLCFESQLATPVASGSITITEVKADAWLALKANSVWTRVAAADFGGGNDEARGLAIAADGGRCGSGAGAGGAAGRQGGGGRRGAQWPGGDVREEAQRTPRRCWPRTPRAGTARPRARCSATARPARTAGHAGHPDVPSAAKSGGRARTERNNETQLAAMRRYPTSGREVLPIPGTVDRQEDVTCFRGAATLFPNFLRCSWRKHA